MSDTLTHVRGLQSVWVPEHSVWVFVWCADDGDLDRNHRIAYTCCTSPAEFTPQKGQFVLSKDDTDWVFCYGVPWRMTAFNGVVKVYFTDLTPALGWPRQAKGETSPASDSGTGKAPTMGVLLEGQFTRQGTTNGPVIWTLKNNSIHVNPGPVLEVSDSALVPKGTNPYGAPSGTLLVEYERDPAGRIKTDGSGFPLIAPIHRDASGNPTTYTAQNFKIGYLALKFAEDYFGVGLHGWIGAGDSSVLPFPWQGSVAASTDQTSVSFLPAKINDLIPVNMFTPFGLSTTINTIFYFKARCVTNGRNITAITLVAEPTPLLPANTVGTDAAPLQFDVGIAILKGTTLFQLATKNLWYTPTIVGAITRLASPGEEPFLRLWSWTQTQGS